MPLSEDLLQALEAIQRYALTTTLSSPKQFPSTESHQMGRLYDHWLRLTTRDALQAATALEKITLKTKQSVEAQKHFQTFVRIIQNRFERTLDYHAPYHPTSNPHGMVWSTDPAGVAPTGWFRLAVRDVHRAITMQWLALHFTHLQFLLMLVRADDTAGHPDRVYTRDFNLRLQQGLLSLRAILNSDHVHTYACSTVEDDYESETARLGPVFRDLLELCKASADRDIPTGQQEEITQIFNSSLPILLHYIKAAFQEQKLDRLDIQDPDEARHLARRLFSGNSGHFMHNVINGMGPPPAIVPASGNDYTYQASVQDHATITALQAACAPGTANPDDDRFTALTQSQYSANEFAVQDTNRWSTLMHPISHSAADTIRADHLWYLAAGAIVPFAEQYRASLDVQAVQARPAGDPARAAITATQPDNEIVYSQHGLKNSRGDPPETLRKLQPAEIVDFAHTLVSDQASVVARAYAFRSTVACLNVETASDLPDTVATLKDASRMGKTMLCEARQALHNFQPQWHEDRAYLHQRLAREPEVVSTLYYPDPRPVPGNYIYDLRNRAVTQRRTVLTWRKRVAASHRVRRLFHIAHCETALMSDVYLLMERLTLAHFTANSTGAFPYHEITSIFEAMRDPLLIQDALVDVYNHLADQNHNDRHEVAPQILAKIEAIMALPEPAPQPLGTTQPMPDDTLGWVHTVKDEHAALLATAINVTPAGGGAPVATTVANETPTHIAHHHMPFTPLVLNSQSMATQIQPEGKVANVAAAAAGTAAGATPTTAATTRPSSLGPDWFKTDNVLCYTPIPQNGWAVLKQCYNAFYSPVLGHLLAAQLNNSATLTHLVPACRALIADEEGRAHAGPYTIPLVGGQMYDVPLYREPLDGAFLYPKVYMAMFTAGAGGAPGNIQFSRTSFVMGVSGMHLFVFLGERVVEQGGQFQTQVHPPPYTDCVSQLEDRANALYTAYKGRRAPFIHPSAWLYAPPAAAVPPNNAYQWRRMHPNDTINGILIQLPVATGAAPAPPAGHLATSAFVQRHLAPIPV